MKTCCEVYHLGVLEYMQAWQLQNNMAAEIARGERPPTLLLLQHPHCYTLGRRGRPEHLLWEEEQLKQKNIPVYWVDRGGDITYHGPGQLVGYPLIPLGPLRFEKITSTPFITQNQLPKVDYTGFLRKLEIVIILALRSLNIPCKQINGLTGVWVQPPNSLRDQHNSTLNQKQPAKIAALGVKVDAQGISRHGFALNIDPDMQFWEGIIPCGLKDHAVTSLAEFFKPLPAIEQIDQAIVASFAEVFNYEMIIKS